MLYNIPDAAGIDAPAIAGDACVEDYPDVPQISDYAVNAMITMVDYTIVNGISAADEATLLAPNGTATREQALIMAERFCRAFEDQSLKRSLPTRRALFRSLTTGSILTLCSPPRKRTK